MRLVIREYLSMLKESGELDALLPDLLLAMGLDVLSRPGTGPRQFGVDLPAVGIDPTDGRQKLFLLTVKRGDITRNDWDGGPQTIRPSLNEIRDSYLRNRVRPEHEALPKKIILVTGGELRQNVEPNWNDYAHSNKGVHPRYGEIEYDFWGGDRLSGLIEQFFLDEYLFPESAQKQIRKTVALADQNEDEPRHFYAFIEDTLFRRDLPREHTAAARKHRQKALRLLNLSLSIVFHWCQESDNLKPALLCAERCVLRAWDWMRQWEILNCNTTRSEYSRVFDSYLDVLRAYAFKLSPYCKVRNGLFGHGEDELEYPLRTFEVIGHLGLLSNVLSFSIVVTEDDALRNRIREERNTITQLLVDVIANNPPAMTPRFDGHAVDIGIGLLALLFAACQDHAARWTNELSGRILFAFRLGRHFPISTDSYDDLVDLAVGAGPPKENLMELSTLLPMLAEWHVVLNLPSYEAFQQAIHDALPQTDLQIWYPDDSTDAYLYRINAGLESGLMLASIQLPATLEELRMRILHLRDARDVASSISCIAENQSILALIASRHFRTPVLPLFWQEQVQEPASPDDDESV
jgi:hypothetical protein